MTRSTSWTIPLLVAGLLAAPTIEVPDSVDAAEIAAEVTGPEIDGALSGAPERAVRPRLGTLGGRTGVDAEIEWDAAGIEAEAGIDPEEEEEAHAVVSCRKRANGLR